MLKDRKYSSFLTALKIKSRALLLLLAASFLLAVSIPLINYLLVFPRYNEINIKGAENDAVRFAAHIIGMLAVEETTLTPENVAPWVDHDLPMIIDDFQLIKVKIFDPAGIVLFSTSPEDIGKKNNNDYFHSIVAKGKTFTKVIGRGTESLEGEFLQREVVETYVPVIRNDAFAGAFELYYDITEVREELKKTFVFSLLISLPFMALFLGIVFATILILNFKTIKEREIKLVLEKQQRALLEDQEKQKLLFKRVENAKRQWERTMDCISEIVILTDPDFSIKRCNSAVTELTGLPFPKVLGAKFTEIIPDTRIEEGNSTLGESMEYFHKASRRWFFLNLFPVMETIDQEPGFVVSMGDITSIKAMTAKLEQTNKEIIANRNSLQKALDNISVLIGDAIEGESYKKHISLNEENRCWDAMECHEEKCSCYGIKGVRCWQKLGTFCNGEVQNQLGEKFKSCPECRFFQSVTEDPAVFISEQFNNLMFMLENKNSELQKAYSEIKQAQAQLLQQEKMASIGQLAAGVAHEINNPVGFISSNIGSLGKYVQRLNEFISLLEKSLSDSGNEALQADVSQHKKKLKLNFILEDINDLIKESLDGCDRVKKIVQDLKGFSRVDQAARQLADINECIDTTLNMVTNELKYKAQVKKEYSSLAAIECHPQQLNQVFMNILINSCHAIEKEGVIAIKTWQDQEFVYASISDTGCGIKEESLKHIFEPFFTTKEIGKGTGLGLSIVYDIITKNHKGDIEVTSEVGKGTTFTIKLPRIEDSSHIEPKDSLQ